MCCSAPPLFFCFGFFCATQWQHWLPLMPSSDPQSSAFAQPRFRPSSWPFSWALPRWPPRRRLRAQAEGVAGRRGGAVEALLLGGGEGGVAFLTSLGGGEVGEACPASLGVGGGGEEACPAPLGVGEGVEASPASLDLKIS